MEKERRRRKRWDVSLQIKFPSFIFPRAFLLRPLPQIAKVSSSGFSFEGGILGREVDWRANIVSHFLFVWELLSWFHNFLTKKRRRINAHTSSGRFLRRRESESRNLWPPPMCAYKPYAFLDSDPPTTCKRKKGSCLPHSQFHNWFVSQALFFSKNKDIN